VSGDSTWFVVIQVLTTATLVATFVAYLVQIRVMHAQTDTALNTSRGQNTLTLIQFLERPEVRLASSEIKRLDPKDYPRWSDSEVADVRTICGAYDVAGMLARAGIVDGSIIVNNWSVRRSWAIALPLIMETRRREQVAYWDDFEWLSRQGDKRTDATQ
jgi:hypothetical protein